MRVFTYGTLVSKTLADGLGLSDPVIKLLRKYVAWMMKD